MKDNPEATAILAEPEPKHGLVARLIFEFKQVLLIFLYLTVLFSLFTYYKAIVLAEHGIHYAPYGIAALKAFVLAKVMLVAEKFDLGRKLRRDKPILFPILHKSFMFSLIFIAFDIVEDVVVRLFKGQSLAGWSPDIGGGSFRGMVTVALIISVSLIPFFAYREVGRVVGRERLWNILMKAREDYRT